MVGGAKVKIASFKEIITYLWHGIDAFAMKTFMDVSTRSITPLLNLKYVLRGAGLEKG